MENNEYITLSELAGFLKVKPSTAYGWSNRNILDKSTILQIGKTVRVRKFDFEKFYNINLSKIITTEEAAKRLNVKPQTIRSWFTRKQIPENIKFYISGTARLREDLFEKFIAGEVVEPTA